MRAPAIVLMALLAVACSGDDAESFGHDNAALQRRADAGLLLPEDIDEEWRASTGAGAALDSARCALDAVEDDPLAEAEVAGFENLSGDSLDHAVMIFRSDQAADRFVDDFAATADCVEERGRRAAGEGAVVVVGETKVPPLGDRAVGLEYELRANGRSAFSRTVAIRVGDAVGLVIVSRLYAPPELDEHGVLQPAVAKLTP